MTDPIPSDDIANSIVLVDEPPDDSNIRRYTSMQWLSFFITMTAIAAITVSILVFDPPTYLAAAALVVVVVTGSILITAEVITDKANRRHVHSDTNEATERHDITDNAPVAAAAAGFDVYRLDIDS